MFLNVSENEYWLMYVCMMYVIGIVCVSCIVLVLLFFVCVCVYVCVCVCVWLPLAHLWCSFISFVPVWLNSDGGDMALLHSELLSLKTTSFSFCMLSYTHSSSPSPEWRHILTQCPVQYTFTPRSTGRLISVHVHMPIVFADTSWGGTG